MIYMILIILLLISIGFNIYSMKKSKLFFKSYKKDLEKLSVLKDEKKALVLELFRVRKGKKSLKEKLDELYKLTPPEAADRGMDITNKLRGRLRDTSGDSNP